MTIEIVDFPIKNDDFPLLFVSSPGRVSPTKNPAFPKPPQGHVASAGNLIGLPSWDSPKVVADPPIPNDKNQ